MKPLDMQLDLVKEHVKMFCLSNKTNAAVIKHNVGETAVIMKFGIIFTNIRISLNLAQKWMSRHAAFWVFQEVVLLFTYGPILDDSP